jgi:3-deoxy-D-manno-octulosonate 8-phosphate phosphatase (KDO 8-P phosphatase)
MIKLAIFDLDGTFTDGMYSVSDSGSISKSFYTRDWWALQRLQEHGIDVVILTHCYDDCIDEKIKGMPEKSKRRLMLVKLDWDTTKEEWLGRYLDPSKNLTNLTAAENVAFMGDSENDVEAMKLCGLTGCPSDAVSIVKEESNFIAESPGGRGAVYEFANYIIEKVNNDPQCNEQNDQASDQKPDEGRQEKNC